MLKVRFFSTQGSLIAKKYSRLDKLCSDDATLLPGSSPTPWLNPPTKVPYAGSIYLSKL